MPSAGMNDDVTLPKAIGDAVDRVGALSDLTPDMYDAYLGSLTNDKTFIAELVSVIGPQAFLDVVLYLGGETIAIPRPQDVVQKARVAVRDGGDGG